MPVNLILAVLLASAPCQTYGVDGTIGACGVNLVIKPSREINAWAKGQTITITTAAIERLSDDELALLLGHEVGHVLNGPDERKADCFGASLAVKSGFTLIRPFYFKWSFGYDRADTRWARMQRCATPLSRRSVQ